MRMTRTLLCCSAATAALLLIAPARATNPTVVAVTIKNLKFQPATIHAHVGDQVKWTNGDFVRHSASAVDKSWNVELPPNGRGTVTLQHTGTMSYFCRYHPNMRAQIIVEAP